MPTGVYPRTKQMKVNLSFGQKKRFERPEEHEKLRAAGKEAQNRPEVKAKNRASIDKYWANPENHTKRSGPNHWNWQGKGRKVGLLTPKEYSDLFDLQNGVCAICGKMEIKKRPYGVGEKDRLSIDHSHKTGQIRGLLCSNCNRGLGCFKDSVEFLFKAIQYLKERTL